MGGALPTVSAVAATSPKDTAARTWASTLNGRDSAIGKVWLDGVRKPLLDRSTAQIGAPQAWQAGVTGKGVKVAVLDSGVDAGHPDLAGREIAEKNFTTAPDATDETGHGTHVASTVAGTGAKQGGKYRGVAPDAQVLDGKVCFTGGCQDSAILAGMQWAVDQGADIANLSLGGPDFPDVDLLEEAVNRLSATSDTLFVISAGNSGPRAETVGSPASADASLAVGSVDRDESMAPSSSRGPQAGDGGVKPDITAPGVGIVAARSSTGTQGLPVGEGYVLMSGTSMAAPHVSGAAALLAQQNPSWTGEQLKAALMASATPNPKTDLFAQGAGRVDVVKALAQKLSAEPSNLAFGVQSWPHEDDQPVHRDVVYRNTGSTEATVDLTISATGPDGKPAAAGAFTVTPAKITVPAGGEAKATVTGNTRTAAMPDGITAGLLLATVDGGVTVRTPLSITREVESYELTITKIDHDGKPATEAYVGLTDVDSGRQVALDPTAQKVRVPKGEYFAQTTIDSPGERFDVLTAPALRVDRDTVLVLDARTAKPVSITTPEPTQDEIASVSLDRRIGDRNARFSSLFWTGFNGKIGVANVGKAAPEQDFSATMITQSKAVASPSTTLYNLAYPTRGAMPDGFTATPTKQQLAEARRSIGPGGVSGAVGAQAIVHGQPSGTATFAVPVGTEVTEWTTTSTQWASLFTLYGKDNQRIADNGSLPREFPAGQVTRERTNYGVFSPAIPPRSTSPASRLGNDLSFAVRLFGSSAGGTGLSTVDSQHTTLFREGTKLSETDEQNRILFRLPAERAQYRLETEAKRSVSELSTSVTAAWTFTSSEVDTPDPAPLPLSVVRFDAVLDDNNAAPSGKDLVIPLSVQQQGDSGTVGPITVEVSFDEGATWTAVPVTGDKATVRNADKPGFAALRAKTSDSKGNAFELTVLRAYRIS